MSEISKKPTWTEFINLMRKNCDVPDDETGYEIIDEIRYQIYDWYDDKSYYPKPEDILQDYVFCTPAEAHYFLPLFIDDEV